jgi:hypothetical protein
VSVNLVEAETASSNADDAVPPSPLPKVCPLRLCPNGTSFLIGRNGRGQWIARERHGLYGGLFVSRENAIRYALFENGHRPEAIVMVTGILELDMAVSPAPDDHVAAAQSRAA